MNSQAGDYTQSAVTNFQEVNKGKGLICFLYLSNIILASNYCEVEGG